MCGTETNGVAGDGMRTRQSTASRTGHNIPSLLKKRDRHVSLHARVTTDDMMIGVLPFEPTLRTELRYC
jgi:hypothetical protein